MYFNSTDDLMKVYTGTTWQQVSPTTITNYNAVDGGFANSTYTAPQSINGGTASG
jgi:hypothetical protein